MNSEVEEENKSEITRQVFKINHKMYTLIEKIPFCNDQNTHWETG